MNPEQYQEYKNKYPNFDQKHVIDVLLKNIEISHIEDQVRTAGEDKDHLYELKDSIRNHGQQVPVVGSRVSDNLFRLHAGVHRFLSKKELCDESGGQEHTTIKLAFGFDEVNFNSRAERVIWQLNENTRQPSKNCDTDDYVEAITGLIVQDHVLGSDLSKITPEVLIKYIRDNITHISTYRAKTVAKKVLKSGIFTGQRKFKNYPTKKSAAEFFSQINPWGLSVSKSGDTDQGYTVYFAESKIAIQQNNLHGAWHKKTDPNSKVLIVAYCGNVFSKTRDLAKWRRDCVAKFNEENSHPFCVAAGLKVFDGIIFLPQVQLGPDTEPENLIINPLNFNIKKV